MITKQQQLIARQQAKSIVNEYLENQDENELQEGIYNAIMEALKHSSNPVDSGLLQLAVEFGYKQCEKGNNIQKALSEYNKLNNNQLTKTKKQRYENRKKDNS